MKNTFIKGIVVVLFFATCAAFYFGIVRRVLISKSIQLAVVNQLHTEAVFVAPKGNDFCLLLGYASATNYLVSGSYTIRDQSGHEWKFQIDSSQTHANWLARKGLDAIFLTSNADYHRLKLALFAGKTYSLAVDLNDKVEVPTSLWLFYTQRVGD